MNEALEVLKIILEVAGIVLVVFEIVERVAQVVRWVRGLSVAGRKSPSRVIARH